MKVVISGKLATQELRQRVAEVLRIIVREFSLSDFYVEINLVGDDVMKKNVLSYVAPKDFLRGDTGARVLGEVYLNPRYIKEHGENFDHMLVHGFLHLLGYDHESEDDREKMEEKERELLAQVK